MASTFTWLDFSEGERRQALEVIDQFRNEDTRDELGLGTVRDSLADLLFPGLSTIQTRARYFFFIPWIYLELERRKIGYARVAHEGRKVETLLIEELLRAGEDVGVIGQRSRGKLQRLPSNVYWAGLRTWGILQFGRSQEEYHRWLDSYYEHIRHAPPVEELDASETMSANWHPHLPSPPEKFPAGANFALTFDEADYLADRIRQKATGSLLAWFVGHEVLSEEVPLPWLHPACEELPQTLRRLLDHARHFSEVMHGAALLYNLLLAESRAEFSAWREVYRDGLADWWAEMPRVKTSPVTDQLAELWSLVDGTTDHRITAPTKTFVGTWHRMAYEATSLEVLSDGNASRQLIRDRERWLKRGRARIGNERMLQDWGGKSGSAQLSFRWGTARQIIDDIVQPLKGSH